MKFKFLAAAMLAATLSNCDDETTGIGDFLANTDEINAYSMTFKAKTRTIKYADLTTDDGPQGVYSRTTTAYLGKFTDVDFGTFSADFITQINCPEGFTFPETIKGIESASLGLYYSSYYGDSLATMRVCVDTLDTVIDDTGDDPTLYYTSYDPTDFYDEGKVPLAQKDYSAYDNVDGGALKEETGYHAVTIDLPETFSDRIFSKYQENKDYFKDSYSFIHNVLPGFYVHNTQGEGSILYIQDIWLHLKVEYTVEDSARKDSTVWAQIPFAATNEVYMSTRLENNSDNALDNLIERDKKHSYLKTPAGLLTEVTLPLEEMYDKLGRDTLNSVSISFTKMKEISENSGKSPYKMGTPQYLLLVRKSEANDFFEKNKTYDSRTSFLATYNSSTNSYSFSQLNRLISQIFSEMNNAEERPAEGWDEHNKLVLIPVETETDSQGNIIGLSHDLEVNSAKLIGGENGEELEMEVIYTQPTITAE